MSDSQTVPRWLRVALLGALLLSAVLSFPDVQAYGPIPATVVIDTWIVLLMLVMFCRGRTIAVGMLFLLVAYAISRIIPAIITDAPLRDFSQAYRWVLYLIVLALAVGRRWGGLIGLIRFTFAIVGIAIAKALLGFWIVGDFSARTGLLLENNFELALYCGLGAVIYRHLSARSRLALFIMLGVLAVVSGSRSGAVAFLIFAIYAVTLNGKQSLLRTFVIALIAPLLVVIPVFVFSSRGSGANGIDRINFLRVFLSEVQNWGLTNWLFGTVPITPLSTGCLRLSYYSELFSSRGDGTCYSVIFHAFALRSIFDAGLVGFIGSAVVLIILMRKAGVSGALTATLFLIAFTNGLSVSGLNSPYVVLPILFGILCAPAGFVEGSGSPRKGQRGPITVQSGISRPA